MTRARTVIRNSLGLHARPAMAFVELANAHACDVTVRRADGDEEVDGKSIMQMLLLAATAGTELEISCDGVDEGAAAAALKALVDSGFDEE